MKLLITGKPRSGKTTLLLDFLTGVQHKQGFVAEEVRENGERVGFDVAAYNGARAVLARVDSGSRVRVGRYGVEVDLFDKFLGALPDLASGALLYIDEIGEMEVASSTFRRLVLGYLDAPSIFVGTVTSIYSNEFIHSILRRDDVVLLEITENNQAEMAELLAGLKKNLQHYMSLSDSTREQVSRLAREYATTKRLAQLQKLFANTTRYLAENRLKVLRKDVWEVRGNTAHHVVKHLGAVWECDCDLFLGRRQFEGVAGECSHILTVKLSG